ncbi:HhH-GPD family protein [Parasphaerochaeta coccoides]|uniref:Adenine DNA glycosylase n=1 Tax=Parasphaerochaeta coccoides (strain ATCC BAA-1237 / DSM 17374 / SPN1) TaxID=760011 RepID=F4GH43_PARC1|nr:HhH-GPD family protein [Parasphaerochaeta coccoides]AEC01518.1 HhH-GPD family protein [Parasphaerochaeta coccoides DSM 17374]
MPPEQSLKQRPKKKDLPLFPIFPELSADEASTYASGGIAWDSLSSDAERDAAISHFMGTVLDFRHRHGRHFPWQQTRDPWPILLSEVMLQQTTTARVLEKYRLFLEIWPDFRSMASVSLVDLLAAWSGLGYNRRALALRQTAIRSEEWGWTLPDDRESLLSLPGIGASTAAAIRCFCYDLRDIYLETNVRRAVLHWFFPDEEGVKDKRIEPILLYAAKRVDDIRQWYYALMDYGVLLARLVPNPNRRSSSYARQTAFKGSDREIRGRIIFMLTHQGPRDKVALMEALGSSDEARLQSILDALQAEGFIEERPASMAAENSPLYGVKK